jgi:hypothetical protein
MNKTGSRIIMGTALGIAAVAVAVDHTRHRLPEPQARQASGQSSIVIIEDGDESANPCGLGGGSASPCSLGDDNANPCGLGQQSPCSL